MVITLFYHNQTFAVISHCWNWHEIVLGDIEWVTSESFVGNFGTDVRVGHTRRDLTAPSDVTTTAMWRHSSTTKAEGSVNAFWARFFKRQNWIGCWHWLHLRNRRNATRSSACAKLSKLNYNEFAFWNEQQSFPWVSSTQSQCVVFCFNYEVTYLCDVTNVTVGWRHNVWQYFNEREGRCGCRCTTELRLGILESCSKALRSLLSAFCCPISRLRLQTAQHEEAPTPWLPSNTNHSRQAYLNENAFNPT